MLSHTIPASILLLSSFAAAKSCLNVTIPVDISSRQGVFKKISIENNLDVTAFIQELTRSGHDYSEVLLEGYQTLQGSYKISAQFCYPADGANISVVQLLTHGVGFDKTYWDLPYSNYNYSYVEAAVRNGFATLAIDRLGLGNSSHGDPFNEIQSQAEVESLNAITLKLRRGEIPGISQSFKKVVHVGHSYGSVQSYWFSSLYPNNTDGLVLTGWSARGDFITTTIGACNFQSARLNQPLRFGNTSNKKVLATFKNHRSSERSINVLDVLLQKIDIKLSVHDLWNEVATTTLGDFITGYNTSSPDPLDYPSGYLAHSSLQSNQFVFYHPGHFDLSLALLSESTKQPITVGELLTMGSSPPSSVFSGPVLVFTGEQDQPFCGGNCFASETAESIPAEARKSFPNTEKFEAYVQKDTGHGLTAHYNATAGFEVVQGWLKENGLGA